MRHFIAAFALGWILSSGTARAFVFDSPSCASCHAASSLLGAVRPGAMEVLAEGLLNLDSARNDGVSRGSIPYFTAHPGETVALTMRVLDGRNRYAVSINNFHADSVTGTVNTNFLNGYGSDPAWIAQSFPPNPTFYTNVSSALDWPASGTVPPRNYTFNLTLKPNTPTATYELEFVVAGLISAQPRPKFVDSKFFYLRVVPLLPGDYNNNGIVDAADYIVWRKYKGTTSVLANDPIGGTIGTAQYNQWRGNFGKTPASGAGTTGSAHASSESPLTTVPEPAAGIMPLIGLATMLTGCRTLASKLVRPRVTP